MRWQRKKFFDLFQCTYLRAQIASMLLRCAGLPRVSNLMRTLPPRIFQPAGMLFDTMVDDAFRRINGFAKGDLGPFNESRVRCSVKKSGEGSRSMVETSPAAYAGAVALTAASGLISPALVQSYYDGGGGGPPPDGGGGGFIGGDVSVRRPTKRRRLHSRSSSLSSPPSSSAVVVPAHRTVVENVEECIQQLHSKVEDDGQRTKELKELINDNARLFWKKFMSADGSSSHAATSFLHNSAPATSTSTSTSSSSSIITADVKKDERRNEALKAAYQLQSKITAVIEDAAFDRLLASAKSTEDAVRMVNCTTNGATLFSQVKPMERSLEMTDFEWRSAIRHKYGMPPLIASHRVWYCLCGASVCAGHNHTCNSVSGPATTVRHDVVVGTLEDVIKQELGFSVKRLPRETRQKIVDGERDKFLIPDLIVSDDRGGYAVAIDVTGLYGEADSYLPKSSIEGWSAYELRNKTVEAMVAREKRKDVHYKALLETEEMEEEMDVVPFVFESHGTLGSRAEDLITQITDYAEEQGYIESAVNLAGYFHRRISIAIQRGNAWLDRRATLSQRNSYSARASLGLIQPLSGAA